MYTVCDVIRSVVQHLVTSGQDGYWLLFGGAVKKRRRSCLVGGRFGNCQKGKVGFVKSIKTMDGHAVDGDAC